MSITETFGPEYLKKTNPNIVEGLIVDFTLFVELLELLLFKPFRSEFTLICYDPVQFQPFKVKSTNIWEIRELLLNKMIRYDESSAFCLF